MEVDSKEEENSKMEVDSNEESKEEEEEEEDGSLSGMRNLEDKGDKGYGYKDGVLMQTIFQDPGQELVRVVVPKQKERKF